MCIVRRCLLKLPVLENDLEQLGQLNFNLLDGVPSLSLSSPLRLKILLFEGLVDEDEIVN